MAEFNKADKYKLNNTVQLCREYRFSESRKLILAEAGLSSTLTELPITELRSIIDNRIKSKVTAPVIGEMLRIESTFRYIRDIHHYNQEQVQSIITNLDKTIPYLNTQNEHPVLNKMENIYHLSGEEPLYHKTNKAIKAIDKVRILNRLLKNKKVPLLTPNYVTAVKQNISTDGIAQIDNQLQTPHSTSDKIRLNEEKVYLIDNSGWNRSQKFLSKSQTYNQLYTLYSQNDEPQKAIAARDKCTQFFGAHKTTLQHAPSSRQTQMQEEWLYK